MKKSKKIVILMVLMVLAAALFTGCSGGGDPNGAQIAPDPPGSVSSNGDIKKTGTITGTITLEGKNIPLQGVTVEIKGLETVTDSTGYFAIAGVPAGNSKLTAYKDNFEDFSGKIRLAVNESKTLNFSMTPNFWGWKNQNPKYHDFFMQDFYFVNKKLGWAAGQNGAIRHSEDGGKTWEPQQSNVTENLLSVFFRNSKTGWVAGNKNTLLCTTDGGETWNQSSPGIEDIDYNFRSVQFISNTGWALGTRSYREGHITKFRSIIIKSTDGGLTWTPVQPETEYRLEKLFFISKDEGWAAGYNVILHTLDGGATWTPQEPPEDTFYAYHDVFFIDKNHGWIAGNAFSSDKGGVILRTTDGGTTWTEQPVGNVPFLYSIHFADRRKGAATGEYGAILYTANSGVTWTLKSPMPGVKLYSETTLNKVLFINPETVLAGGSFALLQSSNGGVTWKGLTSVTSNFLNRIFFRNLYRGWAVGMYDTILFTGDGGKTWKPQDPGVYPDPQSVIHLNDIFFPSDSRGWIVGSTYSGGTGISKGIILSTKNGGGKWQVQKSDISSGLNSVFFTSVKEGWATGERGMILHTVDGGSNWMELNIGTLDFLPVVRFTDKQHGWILGSSGTIYITKDGGTAWTPVYLGTTALLRGMSFADIDGEKHGWVVGNEGTILHTTDGGFTWVMQSNPGAPWAQSILTSVCFTDAKHGWITTLDQGILYTNDSGITWTQQMIPDFSGAWYAFFIDANTGWAVDSSGEITHTITGGVPEQ